MILFGAHISSPVIFKEGEEGPEMMFYTHLIFIFLFLFNILFTFTWIISLFLNVANFKSSKIALLIIYYLFYLLSFLFHFTNIVFNLILETNYYANRNPKAML